MADSPRIKLEKAFRDARGAIQPLVERTMASAVYITCKKGAVRANHYHKTDWHYAYLVYGKMEYFHRPTGSKAKPKKLLVKAGEMVFTPPHVDHAMRFLEDTAFVTLSRNARDHASYEADVVRIQLI